jgi:DNA-binding CsgD family transcriptional regulator
VKSQMGSVYRKLGVRSRSDAVARAQEIGLIAT